MWGDNVGIESLLPLVGQYGLPLVALIGLGIFAMKKLDEYFKAQAKKDEANRSYMVERVEKSEKRQEELIAMGRDISETNRIIAEKVTGELGHIRDEMNEIGNKVDIINIKLDSK